MKRLSIILLSSLFLTSCTNDKPSVIVNLNIIGENSDSIQELVKDAVNNDSARVVNINVYNTTTNQKNTTTNQIEKSSTHVPDSVSMEDLIKVLNIKE